jgi:hypothetical protein
MTKKTSLFSDQNIVVGVSVDEMTFDQLTFGQVDHQRDSSEKETKEWKKADSQKLYF